MFRLESTTKTCPTRLLHDIPVSEDKFGSHAPLAKALSDMISNEPGGKTVGIEGGWGSGKSTIVSLLNNIMSSNSNIKTITFNAWAHEGDPLRRTFLETLISSLMNNGWINERNAQNKLLDLSRRRRIIDTVNTPIITKEGFFLALSIFFVPIGIGVLNGSLGTILGGNWSQLTRSQFDWMWLAERFGLVACFLPLLVVIGICVHKTYKYKKENGQYCLQFPVLIDKSEQFERSEVIETPEPTSVEFEKIFSAVMNEAIGDTHSNKRLVLIIDNLDRISTQEALSVLSNLRTFLEYKQDTTPSYIERLWVVIPYYQKGLDCLYEVSEDSNNSSVYLDKIFQIKFRVPPLVLTNWKNYLFSCLNYALPTHEESEFHLVYRLYDRLVPRTPTPRDLIIYVNSIGALHRQWGDKIPLVHFAYFVLKYTGDNNPLNIVLNVKSEAVEIIKILGQDIATNIAAIFYNVNPEIAMQILLQAPITNAIETGNSQALDEAIQLSPKGFWDVFEQSFNILSEDWQSGKKYKFAHAASAIYNSKVNTHKNDPGLKTIYQLIKERTIGVTFELFSPEIAVGIIALSLLQDKDETYLKNLVSNIPKLRIADVKDPKINTWVEGLIALFSNLDSLGLNSVYMDGVSIGEDLEALRAACVNIADIDNKGLYWKYLKTDANDTVLSNYFIRPIESGTSNFSYVTCLKVLASGLRLVNDLEQPILKRLQIQSIPIVEVFTLLDLLRIPAYSTKFDTIRKTASMSGYVLHHFYVAWTQKNHIIAASCMYEFLNQSPNTSLTNQFHSSQNGQQLLLSILAGNHNKHEIIDEFIKLIVLENNYYLLYRIFDSKSAYKPFIWNCLSMIIQKGQHKQALPIKEVYKRWKLFANEWPDFKTIISDLIKEGFLKYVTTQPFNPSFAEMYIQLIDKDENDDTEFNTWCIDSMRSISEDEWYNYLFQEQPILSLAIALSEKNNSFKVQLPLKNALYKYAGDVLNNRKAPQKYRSKWTKIINLLTKPMLKNLQADIVELAASFHINQLNQAAIPEIFIELFGQVMEDINVLRQNKRTIEGILLPFVKNRTPQMLNWLNSTYNELPIVLKEQDPARILELEETIDTLLNSKTLNIEQKDLLQKILKNTTKNKKMDA